MDQVWSNPLKDVDSRGFTRMLRKDGRAEGRKDGRTNGSVNISLRNFVGEGITISVHKCGYWTVYFNN